MTGNKNTSMIIDAVMRFLESNGRLSASRVPNIPVANLEKFDKNEQLLEWQRIVYNMKKQGLIVYSPLDNSKGIKITAKGHFRARKAELKHLKITRPQKWDGQWRLILFEIPDKHKSTRKAFVKKLYELGFRQLKRSAWLHPFPCREEIDFLALNYKFTKFLNYLEINRINNQRELIKKFKHLRLS